MSKCCNTLESLDLNRYFNLVNLHEELSCLNNLSLTVRYDNYEMPVKHLLSKVSRSLKTLKLVIIRKSFNLSSLLEETLKITTLELESDAVEDLALFLNKCPLVQNLTFKGFMVKGFDEEEDSIDLKNLRKLKIQLCCPSFLCSALEQASKSSVKTIHLVGLGLYQDLKFPVIPELDAVLLESCYNFGIREVSKLFPQNVKVL